MTLEGNNVIIKNNVVIVDYTLFLLIYQAKDVCEYYYPENNGIANNFIFDGNLVIG